MDQAQVLAFLDNPYYGALFTALMIWSLAWKGVALWKAAKNGHKKWFIAMFIINTVGILEIVYIFFFATKKEPKNPQIGQNA